MEWKTWIWQLNMNVVPALEDDVVLKGHFFLRDITEMTYKLDQKTEFVLTAPVCHVCG